MVATFIDLILSVIILIPVMGLFPYDPNASHHITSATQSILLGQSLSQTELNAINTSLFYQLIQVLIISAIIIVFWWKKDATPGKMLFSLKIVDADSLQPPTRKQYNYRYLGYLISTLLFGFGFLWIIFNKRKQGLHDIIAKTTVIRR